MYDESEDQFFVDLPSNVDTGEWSNSFRNKPNYYRTILPRPFEVDSPQNWEVALVGINYPQTFNTHVSIKKCAYTFFVRKPNRNFLNWLVRTEHELLHDGPVKVGMTEEQQHVKLAEINHVRERFERETDPHANCTRDESKKTRDEAKVFSSIGDLIEWLNQTKPTQMKGGFYLTSDEKVSVKLRKTETILFNPLLAAVLGYENRMIIGKDGTKIIEDIDSTKPANSDSSTKEPVETGQSAETGGGTSVITADEDETKEVSAGSVPSPPSPGQQPPVVEEQVDEPQADEPNDNDERIESARETTHEKTLRLLLRTYRRRNYGARGSYFSVEAGSLPDLRISCYNIYCYSNLVRNSLVGNSQVPLLRAIAVDQENDQKHVGLSFDRLRYRPLSSNFFEYIDIRLTDDMGEDLEFKSGKVIVTLKFKRKKK